MAEPIEGAYFNWLCAKVLPLGGNQYYDILRILYQTEYVYVVSGDENREEDGLELREYFLTETRRKKDQAWFDEPCSVLEMFIAFASRASFQTDIATRNWFWEFMNNLELGEYRHVFPDDIPVIEEILHVFLYRMYSEKGDGGMFPLHWPKHDQRKVELWYQFCEYLDDRGLI